jgi:hypothetical protein
MDSDFIPIRAQQLAGLAQREGVVHVRQGDVRPPANGGALDRDRPVEDEAVEGFDGAVCKDYVRTGNYSAPGAELLVQGGAQGLHAGSEVRKR